MVYIYDILVNFNDSYLFDFYEWSFNDEIENLKKIRLYRVSSECMGQFLHYKVKVDLEFLVELYKTCEVYTKNSVEPLSYACLVSDGTQVIAIEFDKTGISQCKSRLLLDEETEVLELIDDMDVTPISYQVLEEEKSRNFITRKELKIKKYLISEIENAYDEKKYGKLKFLYTEYFEKSSLDYESMKNQLISSMNDFLDSKHFALYEVLKLSHKKKQV